MNLLKGITLYHTVKGCDSNFEDLFLIYRKMSSKIMSVNWLVSFVATYKFWTFYVKIRITTFKTDKYEIEFFHQQNACMFWKDNNIQVKS